MRLSTYHQRDVAVNADVAAEEILDESLAVAAARVVLAPAVRVVGRRTHLEPFFQKIIYIVGRNVEIIYTNVVLLQKLGSVLVKHASRSTARSFVKTISNRFRESSSDANRALSCRMLAISVPDRLGCRPTFGFSCLTTFVV